MKKALFLIFIFAMLLTGCSPVMRPPSAVAFMDSYKRDGTIVNATIALYGGDLDNDTTIFDGDAGHNIHNEWVFDGSGSILYNAFIFTIGGGIQTCTPFIQTGLVTPYLGLMGWSSVFFTGISAGGMVIQQIPIGDKWKIGFTEHYSRNGREEYWQEIKEGVSLNIPEARPKFYREAGAGIFASIDNLIAIEFRYGRDLDHKENRFSILLDIFQAVKIKLGKETQQEAIQLE